MSDLLERVRDQVPAEDQPQPSQRYAAVDDAADLEDAANPRTVEDESAVSLREIARDRMGSLVIAGMFFAALLVFFGAQLLRLVPELLSNPWLLRGLAFLTIGGVAYWAGVSGHLSRLDEDDELTLKTDSGSTTFQGELVMPSDDDVHALFIPYKGRTWRGHVANAYSVADVDPELARTRQKRNRDPDAEAVIELYPSAAVERTEYGYRVTQNMSELKPAPLSSRATLRVVPSEESGDGAIEALEAEVDHLLDQLRETRRDKETYRIQARQWRREAKKGRQETEDEFVDRHSELLEAGSNRQRQNGEGPKREDLGAVREVTADGA